MYESGKSLFMEQGLEVLLSHLLRALQKPQDRNQFCQRGFLHLSQALDGKTLAVPNKLLNIHRRANSPNTTSDTSEVLETLAQVVLGARPECFLQQTPQGAGSRELVPNSLLSKR